MDTNWGGRIAGDESSALRPCLPSRLGAQARCVCGNRPASTRSPLVSIRVHSWLLSSSDFLFLTPRASRTSTTPCSRVAAGPQDVKRMCVSNAGKAGGQWTTERGENQPENGKCFHRGQGLDHGRGKGATVKAGPGAPFCSLRLVIRAPGTADLLPPRTPATLRTPHRRCQARATRDVKNALLPGRVTDYARERGPSRLQRHAAAGLCQRRRVGRSYGNSCGFGDVWSVG